MDAAAELDGDVLRHAAIDQIHRLARLLQGLESGGGGRAVVRVVSGNRIDVVVRGKCHRAAAKHERRQEADERMEPKVGSHELVMLRRDLSVAELLFGTAMGYSGGQRGEGKASDQRAAIHGAIACPVRAPMLAV